MRSKRHKGAVLLLGLLMLLPSLPGCGGGSGILPLNQTQIDGVLDQNDSRFSDGSVSDFYIATARRDGHAAIELQSSHFDPYLIVSAKNSKGELENIVEDDNSGGGRNARVTFDVKKGEPYFIATLDNSGADSPGPYTVIFSEILGNVHENPASGTRSHHSSGLR